MLRLIARLLDGVLLAVIVVVSLSPGVFVAMLRDPSPEAMHAMNDGRLLFVLLLVLALMIVQIVLLSREGQTIGRKIVRIKIVDADDESNPGFIRIILMRGLLNGLLNLIPFYKLVDILFIVREDRRCIHDFIASTIVVSAQDEISSQQTVVSTPQKPKGGKFGV